MSALVALVLVALLTAALGLGLGYMIGKHYGFERGVKTCVAIADDKAAALRLSHITEADIEQLLHPTPEQLQ